MHLLINSIIVALTFKLFCQIIGLKRIIFYSEIAKMKKMKKEKKDGIEKLGGLKCYKMECGVGKVMRKVGFVLLSKLMVVCKEKTKYIVA